MFWLSRGEAEDAFPFVRDRDDAFSFADVFSIGDELFFECQRGVAIIECKRDLETVVSYCGALRAGIIPLLIDAETPPDSIERIAARYEVEYWLSRRDRSSTCFKLHRSFRGLNVFLNKQNSSGSIFPDLCMLLPTSGSTGDPKCVRFSPVNLSSVTKSIVGYMGLSPARVSISSLPLHYVFGLSVLNCALEARSSYVLTELSWLDREFWALVGAEGVTDLSGVPFMFELLKRFNIPPEIAANLCCVNQAGGRLDPMLTKYMLDYFTDRNVEFLTMYGQTEASPRMSFMPASMGMSKLGSVGKVIDIGSMETDGEGNVKTGELIYSGPNVCLGYADCRADLALGDINKGVLRTGDIGFIDNDGYITIVGRCKRFVKVFGKSVNLDSVEALVKPLASDVAVIGRDDLIVVVEAENKGNEIRKCILSNVNFPPRALRVATVEEIPRSSSGKVKYQSLVGEFL